MKKEIKYPATMHYIWHPTKKKKGVYAIDVRFPDLLALGLPASTVGNNPKDAIVAAQEILEDFVVFTAEDGIPLPEPMPIEKVSIDLGYDHLPEPFRMVVEYISIERPQTAKGRRFKLAFFKR